MSHSLPQLTLSTITRSLSPTSPVFPTLSPTRTRPLAHDEYLPFDVPRQSGGSTRIPSLTSYEPNTLIEAEAIEPEDLEPRKIELERNLGTDPYQIQERWMRGDFQNPITEDMDEFGKVVVKMSYIQSLHSDFDSVESIADSDLEDGELRNMLASPLYVQSREDCEPSRITIAPEKPAALLQERGASAKRTQADLRESLVLSAPQEPRAPRKPAALSLGSVEPGNQFKSSVFRYADPSNLVRSLLEGNKDHLLNQARSELMKQEHQVESLHN